MVFSRRETVYLLVGDLLVLVASLWVALLIRNLSLPPAGYFEANAVPFIPMFLMSISVFYISGMYEKQTRPIRRIMGVRILGAQAATVSIAAILFFILPLSIAPKTILFIYLLVSVVAESAWRFYRISREVAEGVREPALLVGTGPDVRELYEEVNHNDRIAIRFVELCDTSNDTSVVDSIRGAVAHGVRSVVVDLSDPAVMSVAPLVYEEVRAPASLRAFSSVYEEIFDRVPLTRLNASALLEASVQRRVVYDTLKRLFDILLALALSIIAIPLIGVAALALSIEGGTPLIAAERVGKDGKVMHLLKLRSMVLNDRGDPVLRAKNRVTRIGKLLRKTRIDELPQLWNIIVGDLSFIGPRPEIPSLVAVYEEQIPQYPFRHRISPGLSGWAQIHDFDAPRGSADVEKTRRKLSFDLYYVRHRSVGLDLAIGLKTIRALATLTGT